jgi:hypothetical protein
MALVDFEEDRGVTRIRRYIAYFLVGIGEDFPSTAAFLTSAAERICPRIELSELSNAEIDAMRE